MLACDYRVHKLCSPPHSHRALGHNNNRPFPYSLAAEGMPGDSEALRAEVAALLGTANLATLRHIKAKIEKRNHRTPRTSGCTPRNEPLTSWKPKHDGLAKHALQLILDGAGVKDAPFPIGPNGWTRKLFAASIAEHIVGDENRTPVGDARAAMARNSIAVASLTARIVEAANALKDAEPDRFGYAQVQMQCSRDDAGWSKTTTRGCGVLMNEAGKELFAAAAEQINARLA
jgi:hypothetical protein